MKHGYMILLLTASVFALVFGLLNQLDGRVWVAFGYVALVMFGATLMYLVGWKFSKEKQNHDDKATQRSAHIDGLG